MLVLALSGVALAQEFEMTRWTIDGGGVMRSTGGDFELSGTIGQSDAGVMVGGVLDVNGGFWFSVTPMDCNEDATVNLLDYVGFTQCLAGPQGEAATGSCRCFDIDGSGRVDLYDFSALQLAFPEH